MKIKLNVHHQIVPAGYLVTTKCIRASEGLERQFGTMHRVPCGDRTRMEALSEAVTIKDAILTAMITTGAVVDDDTDADALVEEAKE